MIRTRTAEHAYYFLRDADPSEEPHRFGVYDVEAVRADFPALEQTITATRCHSSITARPPSSRAS